MAWSYYLFWLVVPAAVALVSAHPEVLVLAAIAFVARRWLPDPVLIVRYAARVRSLQQQVELNPANATARTQLAEIWLARHRPRRAIPLLAQALERDPSSAELLYLLGLARLRAGDAAGALEPLDAALARDPKVRYGSAHLARGTALAKLGRLDDAVAAYRSYLRINTSSVEGYCRLSAALERQHDLAGARRIRAEALDTYRVLPPFQRRRQLGWWLRAKLAL